MKSAGVIFMLLAPFVQGQPNIVVESEGNPLAAGATVDFGMREETCRLRMRN